VTGDQSGYDITTTYTGTHDTLIPFVCEDDHSTPQFATSLLAPRIAECPSGRGPTTRPTRGAAPRAAPSESESSGC
jgi:hypothetical protein